MMRTAIEFEERDARIVAWTPCDLTISDIEERGTRLRSWALIVGATIAGPAFVTLRGANEARVCIPLVEWYAAHPETGVSVQREPAGPVAVVRQAELADTHELAESTLAGLGGCRSARADAEFHPHAKGSPTGDLILPVHPEAVPLPLAAAV